MAIFSFMMQQIEVNSIINYNCSNSLQLLFLSLFQWACCNSNSFSGSLGPFGISFRCNSSGNGALYSELILLNSKSLQCRICRSPSKLGMLSKMLFKGILIKFTGQNILKAMVQQELYHIF